MNENKAGLGYQDFEEVRTQHIFYIDKTDFIREWWEYADKVTLITRPRRFGKTLNMSMQRPYESVLVEDAMRIIYRMASRVTESGAGLCRKIWK